MKWCRRVGTASRADYSKAEWEAHENAVESFSRRLEAIVPRRST